MESEEPIACLKSEAVSGYIPKENQGCKKLLS